MLTVRDDMTGDGDAPPWVIIGCGRLGRALVRLAGELGIEVRAAWDKDGPPTDLRATLHLSQPVQTLAGVLDGAAVFVTVSDDAIAAVAAAIMPLAGVAEVVAHCSGCHSSEILRGAGITAPVVSVHPLVSVVSAEQAVAEFPGCAWTVEGDGTGVWWARGWLAEMGVTPVVVKPESKALYHAAAVTSAGLVTALMDAAFDMAAAAGIPEEQARSMLLPLARTALANLEELPPLAALTGPAARGDEDTVAAHEAALARLDDDSLLRVYGALNDRISAKLRARPGTAGWAAARDD